MDHYRDIPGLTDEMFENKQFLGKFPIKSDQKNFLEKTDFFLKDFESFTDFGIRGFRTFLDPMVYYRMKPL